MVLAAIGVGSEMLAAVLQPAHRIIDALREPGQRHLLAAQQALVAEAAADVGRNDPECTMGEAEAFAQAGLHRMWKLGRSEERELSKPSVAISEDAAAFDRHHAVTRGPDCFSDLDRR